ncbi:MAG: hypothetical protein HN986_03665 [Candidatus Marinimicrobia bacterium]|nr:hypothetical protein [Candidatus Neomarinimicrobiota bacterium]
MHLRDYGYSTKKEINERLRAIKYAVDNNGIQPVYERLVKLGEFNPVMKEDAESIARIYELNVEDMEEETVVEAAVPPVVRALPFVRAAQAEKETTWKALRPEVDKGVKLQQICKDAPKMKTDMGVYGVQDNAHSRMQLLQDLADKYGIFSVLSLMATHLVTFINPDQKKIMEGDMSALTETYNEKMKASAEAKAVAEAVVEASAEVSVEEKKEKKEVFLEMLNVKFAKYKQELCCLLDVEDADISFESVYESVVNTYNEKVQKDNKIMTQKIQEFSKTSKIFEKYRDTIVLIIAKDYENKQYSSLRNMLTEMSFSEEKVVQDILNLMISVLKEHKQCQIISVSELEQRQQAVLQENGKMMTEISEMVKKKNVAVSECDLEGYDILTSTIISHYKKVLSMHVDGLVYEIRLRYIKSSLRGIPSDMF